jgi:hypothetical protein
MKNPRSYADREPANRARRKRHKASEGSAALIWILVITGSLLLIGVGVGGYFLLAQGDEKPASPSQPKPGVPDSDTTLAQASDRFMGSWQGTSKEHPSLRLRMEVFPKKLTFGAINVKVNQGDTNTHIWEPIRATGNTLVIRQHPETGGASHDWSVVFASDDQMSVTSLTSNRTLGDYIRIGKQVTRKDRDEAQARNRAKLIGKWSAPTLNSILMHRGIFDFRRDGTAIFDITYDRVGLKTQTGTWKVVEGRSAEQLAIQISGIEGFDLMHLEFPREKELRFSMASKGFTGVQTLATRVP